MTRKARPPERPEKDAGSDTPDATAMGKFKELTRGLLAVPYAQLQAAERRYQEERSTKRPVGESGASKRKRK